jgi:hypothetical protein
MGSELDVGMFYAGVMRRQRSQCLLRPMAELLLMHRRADEGGGTDVAIIVVVIVLRERYRGWRRPAYISGHRSQRNNGP